MTTLSRIRQWLLGALVFGLLGTFVELLLLAHYEDLLQIVPLALIALALVLAVWHATRPGPAIVRTMQALMAAFVVAGLAGVGLHLRGAAEFQREIDPTQSRWSIFKKTIGAQAPPALAPGIMVQFGLLGLIYTYRLPVAASPDAAPSPHWSEE